MPRGRTRSNGHELNHEKFHRSMRKNFRLRTAGHWRVCLGRVQSLPLCRHSNPSWMRSCVNCSSSPCLGSRVGPDDLQRSHPIRTILWLRLAVAPLEALDCFLHWVQTLYIKSPSQWNRDSPLGLSVAGIPSEEAERTAGAAPVFSWSHRLGPLLGQPSSPQPLRRSGVHSQQGQRHCLPHPARPVNLHCHCEGYKEVI